MTTPVADLADLLADLATQDDLRALVLRLPHGEVLARDLPESGARAHFAFETAGVLKRHGATPDVFPALVARWPGRHADIARVAARFGVTVAAPPPPTPRPRPTPPGPDEAFDVFLAYPGPLNPTARQLYALLSPRCRVFADFALPPWSDWHRDIPAALHASQISVVLVSKTVPAGEWQREEVVEAVELARHPESAHRVVPLWLDGRFRPGERAIYGLRKLRGIDATETGGLEGAVAELLAHMAASGMLGPAPRPRALGWGDHAAANEALRAAFPTPADEAALAAKLAEGGIKALPDARPDARWLPALAEAQTRLEGGAGAVVAAALQLRPDHPALRAFTEPTP